MHILMIMLLLDNFQDKRNGEIFSHHFFYYGSASVVAGLIGNASVSKEGIMPLGYAFGTSTRTIAKDEVYEVGGINGLFLFQDLASYAHWHIMFKAKDTLINLSNKTFGYLNLSVNGDKLVITNTTGGSARSATLIYQNISLFAK